MLTLHMLIVLFLLQPMTFTREVVGNSSTNMIPGTLNSIWLSSQEMKTARKEL